MSLPLPHATEPATDGRGMIAPRWYEFFARVSQRLNGPVYLPSFAVRDLPPRPADGRAAYASDAAGGGVPVYSRGGQWLRHDDNTEVT